MWFQLSTFSPLPKKMQSPFLVLLFPAMFCTRGGPQGNAANVANVAAR